METFSALLTLCAGNSPVTDDFPSQRPMTRGFDIFFDLRLNKWLSKQSRRWCFETPSRSLWRHRNAERVQNGCLSIATVYFITKRYQNEFCKQVCFLLQTRLNMNAVLVIAMYYGMVQSGFRTHGCFLLLKWFKRDSQFTFSFRIHDGYALRKGFKMDLVAI